MTSNITAVARKSSFCIFSDPYEVGTFDDPCVNNNHFMSSKIQGSLFKIRLKDKWFSSDSNIIEYFLEN